MNNSEFAAKNNNPSEGTSLKNTPVHASLRMKREAMVICLVVFLGLNMRSWAEQDASLVAYYTFEEGPGEVVKDWSGKGNDGENVNAKYATLPGRKGYALRFDKPLAQVNCGSLDVAGALTFELWLCPETTISSLSETGLVGKGLTSYTLSLCRGGSCWFYAQCAQCRLSSGLPLNTWSHLVATFKNKSGNTYTAKTYLNGALQNEADRTVETLKDEGDFYLRLPVTYGDSNIEPVWMGFMDDVRVYNRALTDAEVLGHYKNEVVNRVPIPAWEGNFTVTPHLTPYLIPASSTIDVVADFSLMPVLPPGVEAVFSLPPVLPPGGILQLELRDSNNKVVARSRTSDLAKGYEENRPGLSAKSTLDPAGAPAGDYKVFAVLTSSVGKVLGTAPPVPVTLPAEKPAWVKAYGNARILNNLVAELLSVQSPQVEKSKSYRFTNPRKGWVWVSSTARLQGSDRIIVSIDSATDKDTVIVYDREKQPTLEAMRYLPAGPYNLSVRCEGASRPAALVVRAIPELIYNELGYNADVPHLKSQGPYDWQFLEKAKILENTNVILERTSRPENVQHLNDWRGQGKKVLSYYNITWIFNKYPQGTVTAENVFTEWTTARGFSSEGYHGIMLDELTGYQYPDAYPAFTEAVTKMSRDPAFKGRVFYPYGALMYPTQNSRNFLKAIIDGGYAWAEHGYISEEPTEDEAKHSINDQRKRTLLRCQALFPNCAQSMIATLGFLSGAPETGDVNPGVNFKVLMDMQMNLIANDPAFFGLCGISWYHSAYADEEVMRWSAKLYRHYCIEGKKEPLTTDPYRLPHLKNGDFAEGTAGWTVLPAVEGSIFMRNTEGYSNLQGRYPQTKQGDTFLATRRSANQPNRFSQQVNELIPGQLYSLKMYIADYGDLINKRGYSKEEAAGKVYQANITIQGGQVLPEKSFRETFGSGLCGHEGLGYDRVKNLPITYVRYVFRAKGKTANLLISDWASEQERGGPAGQELAFNFVQIQPYLED